MVSRIFNASASNCVRTVDCCDQSPSIFSSLEDVINEDLFEAIAATSITALMRVGHATISPCTFLGCLSAELETVAELSGKSASLESVSGIVGAMRYGHSRLSNHYKEISKRYLVLD